MADDEEQHSGGGAHVCVAVRCRPMNGNEIAGGHASAVQFPEPQRLVLHYKDEDHKYSFDHVFSAGCSQDQIFDTLGVPQLDMAFAGYNSTIFAYGQTGSGKTHTMMNLRTKTPEDVGLMPRISQSLYDRIGQQIDEHPTKRFLVQCSFLEIYNEIIYDLLAPKARQTKGGGLEVREAKGIGIYVKDLTEAVVEDSDRLAQLLEDGLRQRVTASTKMNDSSSRSHCVFTVKLHQKDLEDSSGNTIAKLNLVDLAGSERAKATGNEGIRMKEGANINKSLSALGNVINALSSMADGKKKAFVPYRDSKLTRVLQESLGGNSLCTMVANISPSDAVAEETLSTLNYAKRAKTIRVAAIKNDEAAQVRQLEQEVEALKMKLEQAAATSGPRDHRELEDRHQAQIEVLESFISQSWEDKQRLSEQYEEDRRQAMLEAQQYAEKVRAERQRRMQLLEQNGDILLTLQSVNALNSELCTGWPDRIASAVKVGQQLQSQLRAVRLYRESAGADFSAVWGRCETDPTTALTLLGQVRTKLELMAGELKVLGGLEVQLREQMNRVAPEVAVALCEARREVGDTPKEEGAKLLEREEAVALLEVVGRQLAQHYAKERARLQEEAMRLSFNDEVEHVLTHLAEEVCAAPELKPVLAELREAHALSTSQQGAEKLEPLEPLSTPLGLSTLEVPDTCLSASSREDVAHCARLLWSKTCGGWSPSTDSAEEYLEIDLQSCEWCGAIAGISLQGRVPCTGSWQQTYGLLRLALGDDEVLHSAQEKLFVRPPVRLVYEIGVALVQKCQCFGDGERGWQIPATLLAYNDMSREHKVEFFEELIRRTNEAWESVGVRGLTASLSPQEIMAGKSCEETNRFLQLLAYLSLGAPEDRQLGERDVAPQWTTAWSLEYFSEGAGWRWCGAPDGGGIDDASLFEGNVDTSTVKYVSLPAPLVASKLRIHPVRWYRRPALRCEVHVIPAAAPGSTAKLAAAAAAPRNASGRLEATIELASKGVFELQRGLNNRQLALQKRESDIKEKAELERDQLEKRLRFAMARVEELEGAMLSARAENERLIAQVEQLRAELASEGEGRVAAEGLTPGLRQAKDELQATVDELQEQVAVLTDEVEVRRNAEEDLFDIISAKDEELMFAHRSYVDLTQRLQEQELEAEATDLLTEEMGYLQEQLQDIQSKHEATLERSQALEADTSRLVAENEALGTEKEKLLHKIEKLNARKNQYKEQFEASEQARKAARDRCEKILTRRMTDLQGTGETPQQAPNEGGAEAEGPRSSRSADVGPYPGADTARSRTSVDPV